ncbi:hypothetical protein [uncultured Paludibaculum sp.]|uniref:hypothetical protein n=1 Tax=uncultured Paludibaculum sp. TaxID=1765020 RepID=UPI002AABC1ED|nr:hypothetical protein [uncultured Paludibaculum sp.]
MRDPIRVLYYPDFFVDYLTLVKAILLFDELHFMDRPSMMFGAGPGQFGTIGAASPLRQYEASFRDEGVPFYVHNAPMGPVGGEWYEHIKADVNDRQFLRRFQEGLKVSPTFRRLQVAPGNYGEFGNQDDVAQRLMAVDLAADLKTHESAMTLFEDAGVRHFDLSNAAGCAKHLISDAVTCSAKLNFALRIGAKEGFFPLADAKPYGDLLGTKYARAIDKLEPAKNKLQITDLSFAIFDELVPGQNLKRIRLADAIRYRKASEGARQEFLEHLSAIQTKQAAIGLDGNYTGAIEAIIVTEIRPAIQAFRNKLKTIDESLFGAVAKGIIGAAGGSSALTLFGDLSWPKIIALTGAGAAYVAKATVDAILAARAAKRECSLSYILSLDE